MSKEKLIQIRVTEDDKLKIKSAARKMGLTISEFLLYGAMKSISEYEIKSGNLCGNLFQNTIYKSNH